MPKFHIRLRFLLYFCCVLFPLQLTNAQNAAQLYTESITAFNTNDYQKAEILINRAIRQIILYSEPESFWSLVIMIIL